MDFKSLEGKMPSNLAQPHLACVLLVDTSNSMNDFGKIKRLNEGIKRFIKNVSEDENSKDKVDIAIVEFNSSVNIIQDFAPVTDVSSIDLVAEGATMMAEGLDRAIDLLTARRLKYASLGVPSYKPWIVLFTDGIPTDSKGYVESTQMINVSKRVKSEFEKGKLTVITVYIGDDLKEVTWENRKKNPSYYLSMVSTKKGILMLKDETFEGFFDWLSDSMRIISCSQVFDNPKLPPTSTKAVRVVSQQDLNDWMFEDIE